MSEKPEFNPHEESAGYAGDAYVHQPKKQSKQRLNVRVRRGLSWVEAIVEEQGISRLTKNTVLAKTRADIEAALRWIAENKQ